MNYSPHPANLCKTCPALLSVSACTDARLCTFAELTHGVCVIQFEAAEDLVDVSGMEKPIASHHHLETLWEKNKKNAGTIRNN